jgi:hypothetical protein
MDRPIKSICFYAHPEQVGYEAAISTIAGDYFVKNDGTILGPYVDGKNPVDKVQDSPETASEAPAQA